MTIFCKNCGNNRRFDIRRDDLFDTVVLDRENWRVAPVLKSFSTGDEYTKYEDVFCHECGSHEIEDKAGLLLYMNDGISLSAVEPEFAEKRQQRGQRHLHIPHLPKNTREIAIAVITLASIIGYIATGAQILIVSVVIGIVFLSFVGVFLTMDFLGKKLWKEEFPNKSTIGILRALVAMPYFGAIASAGILLAQSMGSPHVGQGIIFIMIVAWLINIFGRVVLEIKRAKTQTI